MALEIESLALDSVHGTLDGLLPFSITCKNDRIEARIATWRHARPSAAPRSISEMRNATYDMLARYREEHKALSRA